MLLVAIPVVAALVLAAVPTHDVPLDPAAVAPAASVGVVTERRATLQAPSPRAHAARRHEAALAAPDVRRSPPPAGASASIARTTLGVGAPMATGAAATAILISLSRDAQAP